MDVALRVGAACTCKGDSVAQQCPRGGRGHLGAQDDRQVRLFYRGKSLPSGTVWEGVCGVQPKERVCCVSVHTALIPDAGGGRWIRPHEQPSPVPWRPALTHTGTTALLFVPKAPGLTQGGHGGVSGTGTRHTSIGIRMVFSDVGERGKDWSKTKNKPARMAQGLTIDL